MQRSDLQDGMAVTVNWPQGAEPATVFWNEEVKTFGLRFGDEEAPDRFPEISDPVLEIVEAVRT